MLEASCSPLAFLGDPAERSVSKTCLAAELVLSLYASHQAASADQHDTCAGTKLM